MLCGVAEQAALLDYQSTLDLFSLARSQRLSVSPRTKNGTDPSNHKPARPVEINDPDERDEKM